MLKKPLSYRGLIFSDTGLEKKLNILPKDPLDIVDEWQRCYSTNTRKTIFISRSNIGLTKKNFSEGGTLDSYSGLGLLKNLFCLFKDNIDKANDSGKEPLSIIVKSDLLSIQSELAFTKFNFKLIDEFNPQKEPQEINIESKDKIAVNNVLNSLKSYHLEIVNDNSRSLQEYIASINRTLVQKCSDTAKNTEFGSDSKINVAKCDNQQNATNVVQAKKLNTLSNNEDGGANGLSKDQLSKLKELYRESSRNAKTSKNPSPTEAPLDSNLGATNKATDKRKPSTDLFPERHAKHKLAYQQRLLAEEEAKTRIA